MGGLLDVEDGGERFCRHAGQRCHPACELDPHGMVGRAEEPRLRHRRASAADGLGQMLEALHDPWASARTRNLKRPDGDAYGRRSPVSTARAALPYALTDIQAKIPTL